MMGNLHLTLRSERLPKGEQWVVCDQVLVFVFLRQGMGHCVVGELAQSVASGDAIVASAEAGARLSVVEGSELDFCWFALRPEHLYPLFGAMEIIALESVLDGLKAPRRYAQGTELASDCHRWLRELPSDSGLQHRGSLLRVASALLAAEIDRAREAQLGRSVGDDLFHQTFSRLSAHELLTLSIDALATRFGCGRRHLNRLFHRHIGLSVGGLRMEMRLIKAAALLRNPASKVISVAAECGFNHQGLFNGCFKRRFGVSPGEWRKGWNGLGQDSESPSHSDVVPSRAAKRLRTDRPAAPPSNGKPCAPEFPLPAGADAVAKAVLREKAAELLKPHDGDLPRDLPCGHAPGRP